MKKKDTLNQTILQFEMMSAITNKGDMKDQYDQMVSWLRELRVLRRIVSDEMKLMIKRKNRKQNDIK